MAVASSGLEREEQRRERDRQHGHHAHRPQGCRAEDREGRRVEVGHERRLAVGGLLVELAPVVDDLGLGAEERLVRVEDVHEERREPQRGRQEEQDGEQPQGGPSPC